ncbi:GumC family protein [Macellibacteroides fermentans]|uniref:GumC family protein n=1 Tax=Macellibacteroides fermentans TaxID=879969 RepID=UPI003B92E06E
MKATVYTGIVSGYTIESGSGANGDYITVSNAMDNLINIIQAENTLKKVSYRLYARNMIHGNLYKDNQYIMSSSFRELYNRTKNNKDGAALLGLIDSTDEDKTFHNILKYEKQDKDNFIYGLFYWNHPHYCYNALKNIRVNRKNNSDLLEITYTSNDPGIAYNTLDILMKEFVNEYRDIRYGETDKVIAYFKGELDRIGEELRIAEDSLTNYNIEKKIINYYDETKEVASINTEFEIREQDATLALNSSKALINQLEKRMGNNLIQIKNNINFIDKLNQISSLTSSISEIQSFSTGNTQKTNNLSSLKKQLENTTKELSDISNQYIENKYSKEGISKSSIVSQWLEQLLLYEKAQSDLEVIRNNRNELNKKYEFFAPVGSTIKRKERNINFTEQNYLSVLRSYNDALMRKKNLEMTSATLKVLNPPSFPIQAQPTKRKSIVIVAFIGSIMLILGFFVLLEIIDRTLHDNLRTELFTNLPVIGAYPGKSLIKYRNYDKAVQAIATKYLSRAILPYLINKKEKLPFIINFLSTEGGDGKSFLLNELIKYWGEAGLNVKSLKWNEDFNIYSSEYLIANSITDLYKTNNEDILLVEHPELKSNNISTKLLNEANLNIIIVRATRGWKDSDSILVDKISNQLIDKKLVIYLNKAERYVVEGYTGMLPPYNTYRKLIYRLLHLELTAKYEN